MPPQQPSLGGTDIIDDLIAQAEQANIDELIAQAEAANRAASTGGFTRRQAGAAALRGAAAFVPPGLPGFIAGAAVEPFAQLIGGEEFNPWQIPVQGAANALKLGFLSKLPGFSRLPQIAQTAVRGGGLAAIGTAMTQQAAQGPHIPTGPDIAGIGLGTAFGGVGGAATQAVGSRLGRRTPTVTSTVTSTVTPTVTPAQPAGVRDPRLPRTGEGYEDYLARTKLLPHIAKGVWERNPPPGTNPITRNPPTVDPRIPQPGEDFEQFKARSGMTWIRAREAWKKNPPPDPNAAAKGDILLLDPVTREKYDELLKQGYGPGGVDANGNVFVMKQGNPVDVRTIELGPEIKDENLLWQLWNLPKELMSTDLPGFPSALFRQGSALAGTKGWREAYVKAIKTYGSERTFLLEKADLENHPLHKRTITHKVVNGETVREVKKDSIMDRMGLDIFELDQGFTRSPEGVGQLAGKIPIFGLTTRWSNRQYTTFMNRLRLVTAEGIFNAAEAGGLNPRQNDVLLRQMGDLVRDLSGSSPLRLTNPFTGKDLINWENHARLLNRVLFSPRYLARTLRLLNPGTYIYAPKFIRHEYYKGLARIMAGWGGLATLAAATGAGTVSLDPTNADFLKIRISGTNTRLDPGTGIQQIAVLMSRLAAGGTTSSVSGRFQPFGGTPSASFKPETMGSTISRFASSKMNPIAKAVVDFMDAQQQIPFHVLDRSAQLMAPMVVPDLLEVAQTDPTMIIPTLFLSGAGFGVQTYEAYETGPRITPTLESLTGIPLTEYDPAIVNPGLNLAGPLRSLR